VFLVNSRQRYFRCGPSCEGQALSLTYGRLFAEFLKEESLVPLRLLASSTSVGLRYGSVRVNAWELFLEGSSPEFAPQIRRIRTAIGNLSP